MGGGKWASELGRCALGACSKSTRQRDVVVVVEVRFVLGQISMVERSQYLIIEHQLDTHVSVAVVYSI